MGITLNPYLNFRGNAREAMEFYEGVFGGKFGVADAAGFRTRWTRLGGRIGFAGGVAGCCAATRVEANKSNSKELIIFIVLSLSLGYSDRRFRLVGAEFFVVDSVDAEAGSKVSIETECAVFGGVRQKVHGQKDVLRQVLALVLHNQVNLLRSIHLHGKRFAGSMFQVFGSPNGVPLLFALRLKNLLLR